MSNINPSRQQLSTSMDRRLKNVMIKVLTDFENTFPDMDYTNDGKRFKGNIRTIINDTIRATRDEFNDYEVEYAPLKISYDGILSVTRDFIESIEKIELSMSSAIPKATIHAGASRRNVLEFIRSYINAGVICQEESGSLSLIFCDVEDCLKAIAFIDKYRLIAKLRQEYSDWRGKVVKFYGG